MRDLESSISVSLFRDASSESIIINGDQIWQYWRGQTLVVKILRMSNPSVAIGNLKTSVDSKISISWETSSTGPAASIQVACELSIEIRGLKKIRDYKIDILS